MQIIIAIRLLRWTYYSRRGQVVSNKRHLNSSRRNIPFIVYSYCIATTETEMDQRHYRKTVRDLSRLCHLLLRNADQLPDSFIGQAGLVLLQYTFVLRRAGLSPRRRKYLRQEAGALFFHWATFKLNHAPLTGSRAQVVALVEQVLLDLYALK